MPGRSALIVPITLPPALAAIRDASDPMAARGVPAHVTILFPFVPAVDLVATDRVALAAMAAGPSAFLAGLEPTPPLDDRVWLVPADHSPFLELTAAVAARWPEHPPYGGAHDVLIPHVTLVETSDPEVLERAAAVAREEGPFEVLVSELWLLSESMTGEWRTTWRFPLGQRRRAC